MARSRRRPAGALLTVAATALLLAGCSDATVVPDAQMILSVSNGTTIPVELVVNRAHIETLAPSSANDLPATALPPLPWNAEVTTSAGRTLLTLTVNSGAVHRSATATSGAAGRVDLSCGRIDIWSGPPMSGPMPGPGVPGDCD